MNAKCLASLLLAGLVPLPAPARVADGGILIDPANAGPTFEGIGAVSAGASSRLLIDYPEPARSRILDLLFKPRYGAGFQHLKVEIGGDINSTDGTEPSHARTREELLHPQREYFERGYEGWLVKEARKRNPKIILDCLAWGAPGWIGNGKFWSQDGADYVASYLEGMKRFHGIDFDYVGILNEQDFEADYIVTLRRTLDARGLQRVRIVAADLNGPPLRMWSIAEAAATNSVLARAIDVFGVHYAHGQTPKSALDFQQSGKRLWSSEDGEWTWETMLPMRGLRAQKINRNFVEHRLTKTEFWSPITAYHDSYTAPQSGVMTANTPWSGAFTVLPELWAVAHTTQFAEPGWRYLDGACLRLPRGGSVVAFGAPNGRDVSVVVETSRATNVQTLVLKPAERLRGSMLRVWRSDAREQFVREQDLRAVEGAFTIRVKTNAIYSLTTTSGQRKGDVRSPAPRFFPSPYRADFESGRLGATPRFFSDCGGAFEVFRREDGGRCLRQQIHRPGIDWASMPYASTVVGSPSWDAQTISVDASLESSGATGASSTNVPYVAVLARYHPGSTFDHFKDPHPPAYTLRLHEDGRWTLLTGQTNLAAGKVTPPGTNWHRLKLQCAGRRIVASLDGEIVADLMDRTYSHGLAGVGCGLHPARFDNLEVTGWPGIYVEPCPPAFRETANRTNYLSALSQELTRQWPANRTINIVCHGHSVPAGYFKTPVVDTFNAYPHLLHQELKARFPHAVVNVVVTAIGGENSESGARRFERDVLALRPDVVTIDYGLNDRGLGLERAETAWRQMIRQAQAAGAKVILLTPTPDTSARLDDTNDALNQQAAQIRRLARESRVGLVDSLALFQERIRSGEPLASLMSQVNHPNRQGHALVAAELLKWWP